MVRRDRPSGRSNRGGGFVLVLTLLVTVLLASTGGAMAAFAATESMLANAAAADFDHELAVDSFLAVFGQLQERAAVDSASNAQESERYWTTSYPNVRIAARLRRGWPSFRVTGSQDVRRLFEKLRSLARDHGLPEENLRLRPIVDDRHREQLGAFVWYDQLVSPTEFEELFPWRFGTPDGSLGRKRKSWSDFIGFWEAGVLYFELETTVGNETRRWFVVARESNGMTSTLVREAV